MASVTPTVKERETSAGGAATATPYRAMGWALPATTAALRRAGAAMCFRCLSAVRAHLPRSRPTPRRRRRSKTRRAP
eukprot:2978495-Alexandrium_andersonii.AAC.1